MTGQKKPPVVLDRLGRKTRKPYTLKENAVLIDGSTVEAWLLDRYGSMRHASECLKLHRRPLAILAESGIRGSTSIGTVQVFAQAGMVDVLQDGRLRLTAATIEARARARKAPARPGLKDPHPLTVPPPETIHVPAGHKVYRNGTLRQLDPNADPAADDEAEPDDLLADEPDEAT